MNILQNENKKEMEAGSAFQLLISFSSHGFLFFLLTLFLPFFEFIKVYLLEAYRLLKSYRKVPFTFFAKRIPLQSNRRLFKFSHYATIHSICFTVHSRSSLFFFQAIK